MCSDYSVIKLQIYNRKKSEKTTNGWKLNNIQIIPKSKKKP